MLGVGELGDDALVHQPVGAAGGPLRQKVDVDPRVLAPVAVVVAAADHLAHQEAVRREEGLDALPRAPRGPVLDVQVDLQGRASRGRLPAVRKDCGWYVQSVSCTETPAISICPSSP